MIRLLIILALAGTQTVHAAGETGLAVFKIGVGARATAMGEAFVASSDDATGLFWNPAGSAYVAARQGHFSYNKWIQGIQNHIASVLFPSSIGTFGVGIMLNSVSDMELRETATEEPLGYFSSHDFSITLNYARMIYPSLAIGINAKYLNEKIYIESASGFAVDLGFKYQTPVYGLYCAAAVQNLGTTARLEDEKINLPKIMRLGAVYYLPFQINNGSWVVAADYVKLFEDKMHFNFGTELSPLPHLTLRTGYQTGYDDKGVSAGFGIRVRCFTIDYAYVPFERNLGDAQRFSLFVNF